MRRRQIGVGLTPLTAGRILLVGSFSARFPQYIIPYAADKARLRAFALGLHEELRVRSHSTLPLSPSKGSGVEVQYQALGAVLTPGYQKTAGSHAVPGMFRVCLLDCDTDSQQSRRSWCVTAYGYVQLSLC